jgi:hypothetical protein
MFSPINDFVQQQILISFSIFLINDIH